MQKFASQLHLSKQFILLHLAMLFGSLAIVWYLPWTGIIKTAVMFACFGYSFFILHQHRRWRAIRHDESGWWLQHADEEFNIEIAGESTVTTYVTVLRFIIPGKRLKQSFVIFRDAMRGDSYRQFVVRLRNMR
jgi:hypothetical protein